jgi:ABC-2 type transport system permease protein
MIATPLLLAVIIGLAFSGLSGDQPTFSSISIAIVNQDTGGQTGGQNLNLGTTFTEIFTGDTPGTTAEATTEEATAESTPAANMTDSPEDTGDAIDLDSATCDLIESDDSDGNSDDGTQQSLQDLFNTTVVNDPDTARAGVDNGTYVAAIIIPSDFTQQLSPVFEDGNASLGQTQVDIYASDASPVSANIIRSVTDGILQQFVTGNVTIAVTLNQLIERAQTTQDFGLDFILSIISGDFNPQFVCGFVPGLGNLDVQQQPLTAGQEESQFVQTLIAFGAAQAVFFALFTSQQGLLSIYEERENWTLQRLIISPTPRLSVLVGKIAGSVLVVFLQIGLLVIAMTLIGSLAEGQPVFIWGPYPLLLILTVIVITVSVSGLGMLITGVAQTPQQANTLGNMINVALAAIGGAFGFMLPQAIAQFSLIYHGVQALQTLSNGSTDIALNLLVLLAQGGLMFVVGAWLFSRRDIV